MAYRPHSLKVHATRVPAPHAARGWRRVIEIVNQVQERLEVGTPAPQAMGAGEQGNLATTSGRLQ